MTAPDEPTETPDDAALPTDAAETTSETAPAEFGEPAVEPAPTVAVDSATAPAPEATAAAGAPGWIPPEAAPSTGPSRILAAVAWVLTVPVLVFAGALAYRAAVGSGPFRLGYAIGAIALPIIVAVVLRWLVVRQRPAGSRRILGSGWVPLTIMLLAVLIGARSVAALTPPPPVDPATAVRISAPWAIDDTEAETVAALEAQARTDKDIRSATARHLVGPNGESAFLLVVDGSFRDDPSVIEEVARNMTDTSASGTSIETIDGVPVALTDGAAATVLTWIESPLGLVVVSADTATGRQIVESILAVPAGSPAP